MAHADITPTQGRGRRNAHSSRPSEPRFGTELYNFLIIGLCAWAVALYVLPPRLERHTRLLELEDTLRGEVEELKAREAHLATAILAVENDPFYREEAHRHRLGVKKKGEEFLKKPPSDFR